MLLVLIVAYLLVGRFITLSVRLTAFAGQETAVNSETIKRQRRWNYDGLKVAETVSATISPSTTPRDAFQPVAKRAFSRSDPVASDETPKERVGK